jgi:arginine/lysine/ornithine decarboxylase
MPLADYVTTYAESQTVRFDTPGHKAGRALPAATKQLLALGGAVDMTLPNEALEWSNGCVYEAEQLAAKLWGATRSFFSYNGTTAAIQAMLFAILNPDDKVLVANNCHRSVMNGLILVGAQPVFLQTSYNANLQLDFNVTASEIERALSEHADFRAVVITNPTYYGVGCDVRAIAKIAHDRGIPLLVDEAHGAHWRFSNELPDDAIACGADVVAQSTHKMLNSLSQTSMLHVNSNLVDCDKIGRVLKMLQSSSPNYLLLASLDAARTDLEQHGYAMLKRTLELSGYVRRNIAAMPVICYNNKLIKGYAGYCMDESKLVIDFSALGYSGVEIFEKLIEQSIMPEMYDNRNVLFHITIGDDEQSVEKLLNGLRTVCSVPRARIRPVKCSAPPLAVALVSPRQAFFSNSELINIEYALGRVSARSECFYPPGIPFVFPGAEISKSVLAYIHDMEAAGIFAEGHNGKIKQLEVLAL